MSKVPSLLSNRSGFPIGPLFIGALFVLGAELVSKRRRPSTASYSGPAGGWGSAKAVATALLRARVPLSGARLLLHQNKHKGFACVSCAWAKPKSRLLEVCENGAKATAWEADAHRANPDFFAKHTVHELLGWTDHHLERQGRLTHPLRWDSGSDKYLPVRWEEAFQDIGEMLRTSDPRSVVFYTSGRASLETSYMYALMVRLYGSNNLPDCSNMCHESTSVALPESIGVPVGTVALDDFEKTDCIFFFGQNVGSNSPRMMHQLQDAAGRGVQIITFNPLRERGLERFTNPQSPSQMLTGASTKISTQYHQLKAGGDIAAIMGICKSLIEMDDHSRSNGRAGVLDHTFIAEHVHGFDAFAENARQHSWPDLERRAGLSRSAIEAAAAVYARAERVIGIYGMGLTQHRAGVEAVQMLANLLLLRGNIGKPGAGICPVRGHSNVQGQRTVGITEKPELVPLDKLAEQFGFEPPREKGMDTVEACEGIVDGRVAAFVMLGGNFVRAIPDREKMEAAWQKLRLTVSISTKLNRSHLIHGHTSYILPCLGRTEIDRQATGVQAVSTEDSTGVFHASRGFQKPASQHLLSEPRIVAGIAKAILSSNPKVDWDSWCADYSRVRQAIETTYPENFSDFNTRMWRPAGFQRKIPARERQWKTKTGKANLIPPKSLREDRDMPAEGSDIFRMITLRSNDQFNTTIYGYDDRLRGIRGTRDVLLMNRNDIVRLGLTNGEDVTVATASDDGVDRTLDGLHVVTYDIPEGCVGAYYPEANVLIPLWHHAERSKVPAAKSIPVRIYPRTVRFDKRAVEDSYGITNSIGDRR
jgi:molybdopterin-dependent oxidoreductase alpha subunit